MSKMKIQHPCLRLVLLGDKCENSPIGTSGSRGWVHQAHGSAGGALLTYIVSKAFSIHRFPTHFEKFYSCKSKEVENIFDSVNLDAIEECVLEITKIYEHTQSVLHNDPNMNIVDGKIFIQRGLRGELATALKLCAKKAVEGHENYVTYATNIISSYAHRRGFTDDGAYIKEWVPVEDVLLCDDAVEGWGEDEFLVLNRDPRGFAKLDLSTCEIEAPDSKEYEKFTKGKSLREALEFVYARHSFNWIFDPKVTFPLRESNTFEKLGRKIDRKLLGEKFEYEKPQTFL